jgi:hypothetical protein
MQLVPYRIEGTSLLTLKCTFPLFLSRSRVCSFRLDSNEFLPVVACVAAAEDAVSFVSTSRVVDGLPQFFNAVT